MEKVVMKATIREETGKSACKHLRQAGRIPGIVYKGGKKGVMIYVDTKELWHALHTDAGENAIITLDISDDGKKTEKTVIMHELQTDPINDKYVHVDFQEISLTEIIRVEVPVTLKGEPVGLKEGGILSQGMWELEVECRAMDVPEHIDVHVDELDINDAIHIKDLQLPAGVKALGDPEQVVASVTPPQAEEEEAAPEEGAEAGEEEPEVIKKGKKEEEVPPEGEEETAGGE